MQEADLMPIEGEKVAAKQIPLCCAVGLFYGVPAEPVPGQWDAVYQKAALDALTPDKIREMEAKTDPAGYQKARVVFIPSDRPTVLAKFIEAGYKEIARSPSAHPTPQQAKDGRMIVMLGKGFTLSERAARVRKTRVSSARRIHRAVRRASR